MVYCEGHFHYRSFRWISRQNNTPNIQLSRPSQHTHPTHTIHPIHKILSKSNQGLMPFIILILAVGAKPSLKRVYPKSHPSVATGSIGDLYVRQRSPPATRSPHAICPPPTKTSRSTSPTANIMAATRAPIGAKRRSSVPNSPHFSTFLRVNSPLLAYAIVDRRS
jgi:hypothetical protein